MVLPIEAQAIIHGFLGTVVLMSFSGAFAELVGLSKAAIRRVRIGVTAMFAATVLTVTTGIILYIPYRAAGGPRSEILAGPIPWVHTILFELKEYAGVYAAIILLMAVILVSRHGDQILAERRFRLSTAWILVLSMLVVLLTYGLGAYVTKIAPL